MGRLSPLSARSRLCSPRPRHLPGRERRMVEGLLRRIRPSIRAWPSRSGIIGETMAGPSGRRTGPTTTGRRMANPRSRARHRRQAISIRRIPMMFPGIGPSISAGCHAFRSTLCSELPHRDRNGPWARRHRENRKRHPLLLEPFVPIESKRRLKLCRVGKASAVARPVLRRAKEEEQRWKRTNRSG